MRLFRKMLLEICPAAILMTLLGSITLNIACYIVTTNTSIYYPIEIWIEGCSWLDFFLPLIAVTPFSYTLYMKRKNNYLTYAAVRIDGKRYIRTSILAGMTAAGVSVFIIYFSALLISLEFFYHGADFENKYLLDYIFGTMQAEHPVWFGLLWCLWKGLVSSLFTWFGYRLALYINQVFLISTLPFLYCMAENMCLSLLGKPAFSLTTVFVLNRLSPQVMHVWNYGFGLISYVIVVNFILWILKKKRGGVYESDSYN